MTMPGTITDKRQQINLAHIHDANIHIQKKIRKFSAQKLYFPTQEINIVDYQTVRC